MKRVLISLCVVLMSISVWAQNKAVDKLFDKYAGKDGFTTVVITKYMFGLFSNIETSEDDEYMEQIKNLNSIRILTAEGESVTGINFYKEVMKALPEKDYKELMVIKDEDTDVKFLIKEEKKEIRELLMLVGGDDENVLISIDGIIDMQTVAKLSKQMNIEGMENLENLEKEKEKEKLPLE